MTSHPHSRHSRPTSGHHLSTRRTARSQQGSWSPAPSRQLTGRDLWLVRHELGLSRRGLATLLNLAGPEVILAWETGDRQPTPKQLRSVLRQIRRHAHRSRILRDILRRLCPPQQQFHL